MQGFLWSSRRQGFSNSHCNLDSEPLFWQVRGSWRGVWSVVLVLSRLPLQLGEGWRDLWLLYWAGLGFTSPSWRILEWSRSALSQGCYWTSSRHPDGNPLRRPAFSTTVEEAPIASRSARSLHTETTGESYASRSQASDSWQSPHFAPLNIELSKFWAHTRAKTWQSLGTDPRTSRGDPNVIVPIAHKRSAWRPEVTAWDPWPARDQLFIRRSMTIMRLYCPISELGIAHLVALSRKQSYFARYCQKSPIQREYFHFWHLTSFFSRTVRLSSFLSVGW